MLKNEEALKEVDSLIKELLRLGLESDGLDKISSLLKLSCDELNNWLGLAKSLRENKNYIASNTVYQHAIRLFGTSARLWNSFGILLQEWGRLDDALDAFDHAASLDKSYARPLESKGRTLELLGRYTEAIEVYKQVLQLEPDNANATNNMGSCLISLTNDKDAETWFRKALSIDTQHTNAMFNLALLLVKRSAIAEASIHLSKLEMLRPDDEGVHHLRKLLSNPSFIRVTVPEFDFGTDSTKRSGFLRKLRNELAGDPKSIFISYAWPEASTRELALRLSRDLREHGYKPVIDVDFNLTAEEVLYLLANCQNVLFLNDLYFVESCLLGKIPITQKTLYPAFAMPKSYLTDEKKLESVFKAVVYAWGIMAPIAMSHPDDYDIILSEEIWKRHRDFYEQLPDLRLFVEGWRLDEVQMVFSRLSKHRSITIVYVNGNNCLSGYPVVDCSNPRLYDLSIGTLAYYFEIMAKYTRFERPPEIYIDPRKYSLMSRGIKEAVKWRISSEDVVVMRAYKVRKGNRLGLSFCREWERVPS